MTKALYDKEIKWKNCLFRNRCPILDLNNRLFVGLSGGPQKACGANFFYSFEGISMKHPYDHHLHVRQYFAWASLVIVELWPLDFAKNWPKMFMAQTSCTVLKGFQCIFIQMFTIKCTCACTSSGQLGHRGVMVLGLAKNR